MSGLGLALSGGGHRAALALIGGIPQRTPARSAVGPDRDMLPITDAIQGGLLWSGVRSTVGREAS